MKENMQDTRVMEYANLLEPEQGDIVRGLAKGINDAEQKAAHQASHNARLSLALLDQSDELLSFLHDQVTPKPETVYGARGKYRTSRPQAALISGRM